MTAETPTRIWSLARVRDDVARRAFAALARLHHNKTAVVLRTQPRPSRHVSGWRIELCVTR